MCLTSMTYSHDNKDNAFINKWKLSQNCITAKQILYIDTIVHAEILSKRVFPVQVLWRRNKQI